MTTHLAPRRTHRIHCQHLSARHNILVGEARQSVVLPCFADLPVITSRVEWLCNDTREVHLFRNKRNHLDYQDKHYKGRTSLFDHEPSPLNFSLRLSDIQVSDGGKYKCSIFTNTKQKLECFVGAKPRQPGFGFGKGLEGLRPLKIGSTMFTGSSKSGGVSQLGI
uniref:Ig-like domain-containing protein n=1 Tax=Mola mola TaxID=94237 RepID=A0A3Q3X044_MOLML